jgi:hypothetical protein
MAALVAGARLQSNSSDTDVTARGIPAALGGLFRQDRGSRPDS